MSFSFLSMFENSLGLTGWRGVEGYTVAYRTIKRGRKRHAMALEGAAAAVFAMLLQQQRRKEAKN